MEDYFNADSVFGNKVLSILRTSSPVLGKEVFLEAFRSVNPGCGYKRREAYEMAFGLVDLVVWLLPT